MDAGEIGVALKATGGDKFDKAMASATDSVIQLGSKSQESSKLMGMLGQALADQAGKKAADAKKEYQALVVEFGSAEKVLAILQGRALASANAITASTAAMGGASQKITSSVGTMESKLQDVGGLFSSLARDVDTFGGNTSATLLKTANDVTGVAGALVSGNGLAAAITITSIAAGLITTAFTEQEEAAKKAATAINEAVATETKSFEDLKKAIDASSVQLSDAEQKRATIGVEAAQRIKKDADAAYAAAVRAGKEGAAARIAGNTGFMGFGGIDLAALQKAKEEAKGAADRAGEQLAKAQGEQRTASLAGQLKVQTTDLPRAQLERQLANDQRELQSYGMLTDEKIALLRKIGREQDSIALMALNAQGRVTAGELAIAKEQSGMRHDATNAQIKDLQHPLNLSAAWEKFYAEQAKLQELSSKNQLADAQKMLQMLQFGTGGTLGPSGTTQIHTAETSMVPPSLDPEGDARRAEESKKISQLIETEFKNGISGGLSAVNWGALIDAGAVGKFGSKLAQVGADVGDQLGEIGSEFGDAAEQVGGALGSLSSVLSGYGGIIMSAVSAVGSAISEVLSSWIDSVKDAASKLSSAVQDVGTSTEDLFEKSVVAPGKQVFAESRAGQAGEAGKGVTAAGAAVAAALMGVAFAAVQLIGAVSSFPALMGVAFNVFVLALATYLLPISPIILAMGSGVAGLLALIVVSTAALAVMVVAVLAVPAALVLFTSAVVGMGIVMFQLSTQTKSYQALQRAFAASMDRIVQALEPFFENMIGLAGLFDALVSVFLPLAASFANGTTLFRLMFDVVKTVAIGLALFAIAVALIATVVLANVIGFATAAKGLLEAFAFVQTGINLVADAMMFSAAAILQGILQTFESALPQSVKDGLQGMIDNLSGQVGKGTTTRALTEGLQGIADAATAMSPDIDGMGAALNELTNLTYDEATQRGQILAREKQMSSELTNIPQGFKVAAARFRAIVGESMGGGGSDVTAKSGNNFIIDTVQVMADSAHDMADDLMEQATQKSFQQTGSPGVPWRQP